MQQVTIVGLGLIGASIGLGLRRWATDGGQRPSPFRIVGFDIELLHQNEAKRMKAVDRTTWTLTEALEGLISSLLQHRPVQSPTCSQRLLSMPLMGQW